MDHPRVALYSGKVYISFNGAKQVISAPGITYTLEAAKSHEPRMLTIEVKKAPVRKPGFLEAGGRKRPLT